jgi:hypothetical protein
MGQSVDSLGPEQRAGRYRRFAHEALRKAAHARTDKLRAEYTSMALSWHSMAVEMESTMRGLAQLEASQARVQRAWNEKRH